MKIHGLIKKSRFGHEYAFLIDGGGERTIKILPPFSIMTELDKDLEKCAETKKGWKRCNLTIAPVKDPGSYPAIKGQEWKDATRVKSSEIE